MKVIENLKDYEVLFLGNGKKIERWNNVILDRPETSAIWSSNTEELFNIDARYSRNKTGGGSWDIYNKRAANPWVITYNDLTFNLKLMGFKHTGIFPEQAYNWDYLYNLIKINDKKIKVLNLFAYTGGATLACLSAGADVTHVDSSKGMVDWAKENLISSKLENEKVRFIVEDVIKFVKREIRRGSKYEIIIMDPPTFGRGNKSEIWNIEDDLYNLVNLCVELLSNEPLCFLINSYSNNIDTTILENIMKLTISRKFDGNITSDSLGFRVKDSNLIMPCGIFARWDK